MRGSAETHIKEKVFVYEVEQRERAASEARDERGKHAVCKGKSGSAPFPHGVEVGRTGEADDAEESHVRKLLG